MNNSQEISIEIFKRMIQSDKIHANQEKSTGLSDSVFFIILGLILHPLFLIISIPASLFAIESKQKFDQFEQYLKYYQRARKLNHINYALLFIYLSMRSIVLLSYLYGFEINLFNQTKWSNSILISFISDGLQR